MEGPRTGSRKATYLITAKDNTQLRLLLQE